MITVPKHQSILGAAGLGVDFRSGACSEISAHIGDFRSSPNSGHAGLTAAGPFGATNRHGPSFNHLVGTGQQSGWQDETKCFGGLEINRHDILRGLFHRNIRRSSALDDFVD
jgi:hypothetical protein